MTRYRLWIEYDGRPFCGWQRQKNGLSIQQVIEQAVTAFCGEIPTVEGAGRTDSGVHATGMVAHVDIEKSVSSDTVCRALNAHLGSYPVCILAAAEVNAAFHARFSAIQRRYTYRIINRRAPLTLDQGLAWHVPARLDHAAMSKAAQKFTGTHDFTTFRSTACQARSAIRTIDAIQVHATQTGQEVLIHICARSFLHNQVRIMTGALVNVGRGIWTEHDIEVALHARKRSCGPATAPPDGLVLTRVVYESDQL